MATMEDAVQKHRRAGEIAGEVREELRKIVREGMPILDLCEIAEALIRKKGGTPAFPCNVSVDEVAAHYTSPPEDDRRVPEGAIVKVDIGVHLEGYIADTATTICFNPEYRELVDTANEALRKAIEILKPGLSILRFGSIIQKTIKVRGFKPVSNLTGHSIGRYMIHAGKSLPNVVNLSASRVKVGEIYGVEPFVTVPEAAGRVKPGKETHIFRLSKSKSLKDPYAKNLASYIRETFRTLPFAERWLQGRVPSSHYQSAFSELQSSKILFAYPVFIEESENPVAQAEHTVLVVKDGCEVLT